MKRSDFLKGLGLAGVATIIPVKKAEARPGNPDAMTLPEGVDCVLIPQETEGPYPLDLSGDPGKFRQDVTEGKPGLPMALSLTIVNVNDNCAPIPNARVDIWHCDRDGVYSGYQQPGVDTRGQTFMRGIQMTDSVGKALFTTIYPGWYPGRITHIHFQVFLNSVLKATSQLAFPDELNNTVYSNTSLYPKGPNTSVANNSADSIFSSPPGGLQYQIATMSQNSQTGGYNAELVVGINGPVSGLINLEPETGGQFTMQQNFPNPFRGKTMIGFTLVQPSHVEVKIFDMNAREIATVADRRMGTGEQSIEWDTTSADRTVAPGNYVVQLTVTNDAGRFTKCKVMTVIGDR